MKYKTKTINIVWFITVLLLSAPALAQEDDLHNMKPESTEHRFPETTAEGKRAAREKAFDAIVERMESNRNRMVEVNKQIQELTLKGVSAGDSRLQKLYTEKIQIEKDDKQLEEDIKATK